MSVDPTDEERRTNETVRAIVLAVGALLVLLAICWIAVSYGTWRLAETWKAND